MWYTWEWTHTIAPYNLFSSVLLCFMNTAKSHLTQRGLAITLERDVAKSLVASCCQESLMASLEPRLLLAISATLDILHHQHDSLMCLILCIIIIILLIVISFDQFVMMLLPDMLHEESCTWWAPPTILLARECVHFSHTHSKWGFGTHLKTYLSLDSVTIYKGAFYTRSNFTLKVFAEFG